MINAKQARDNFKTPLSELEDHIKKVSKDQRTTDYFCYHEKQEVVDKMIIVLTTQGFAVECKAEAGAKRLRIKW